MGSLRLLLALAVVGFHAYFQGEWTEDYPLTLPDGRAAVQMFYLISGFYMALVLNEKYLGSSSNWLFYTNRFLRLWPSVVIVNLFVIASFFAMGEVRLYDRTSSIGEFLAFLGSLDLASQVFLAFTNLFVIGQDLLWFLRFEPGGTSFAPGLETTANGSSLSLNHPLFTVAIEAFYYIISPFVIRRGWRVALGFVIAGGLYHVGIFLAGLHRETWGYHFFLSAAYFYFFGACAYHLYRKIKEEPVKAWLEARRAWVLAGCVAVLLMLVPINWFVPRSTMFMAPILALVVPFLFILTRKSRLDRMAGELSFGVYLIHYPILFIIGPAFDHMMLWLVTSVLSIAAALVLLFTVDLPIDRWRQRRATASPTDRQRQTRDARRPCLQVP
jgi:peptidoglycan/LPS O-acetylase OafA/YrhL